MSRDDILDDAIAEATGLDVESIGEAAFRRSVDALLARRGFKSRVACAAALPDLNLEDLMEDLVVPETWFFRDRGPFAFLSDWVRRNPRDFLRVLSVPCSTGEESYSIAITLIDAGLAADRFSIDAVDISRRALEKAARAVYRKSSFRDAIAGFRAYFTETEDGLALSDDIRTLVRFHRDDLVRPSYLARQRPYDIVFCRNLLIYLNAEARRAVLNNVSRLLARDGVAVAGASELPTFVSAGYTAEPERCSFACRKAGPAQPGPRRVPSAQSPGREAVTPRLGPEMEASLDVVRGLADKGALGEASRLCDRLLASAPADPEHQCLRGILDEALDRLDAAEDSFRKALYLDPGHYPALLHMSALCYRRGERSKGDLFRRRAQQAARGGVESDGPLR